MRNAASKLMWVGRATVFMVGLSVMLALVLGVATTALAAIPGDPFRLGEVNSIDAMSALVGGVAGTMLTVDNNSTAPGATALELRVAPGQVPMKVNSGAKVALLNADTLDGRDSAAFLGYKQKAADSDMLDGKDSTFFAKAYKRTVVVSPTGTDTQNGTALLNTLKGITDASATKKYLLYIEPGTYDLGSGSLQMKQYVDIQGAGELNTLVTSTVTENYSNCGSYSPAATVVGANNVEMRFLTVRNTGAASEGGCAIAIRNANASPRLSHMRVEATGMGAVDTINKGLRNIGSGSSPLLTDVRVMASGAPTNFAVENTGTSGPTMINVTATASGEALGVGVLNAASTPTIIHSKLSGTTYSLVQTGDTIKVALTQLVGAVYRQSGTLQCFNNYDQNMAAVTCP